MVNTKMYNLNLDANKLYQQQHLTIYPKRKHQPLALISMVKVENRLGQVSFPLSSMHDGGNDVWNNDISQIHTIL